MTHGAIFRSRYHYRKRDGEYDIDGDNEENKGIENNKLCTGKNKVAPKFTY